MIGIVWGALIGGTATPAGCGPNVLAMPMCIRDSLGGLLIHGLFPGPDLFTEKADITYTFISGLLLAQFFMCFFGLLSSRYSHLVANAPNYMMFAAVMILCVFGSYCVQNSYEDVILMFILGVLMFVLAKFGFPSAPIVLGIILGPIAEENFLRGKMIADTDVGVFSYFFTGGLNLALIALCLLSLIWGIYRDVYKRQIRGPATSVSCATCSSGP